MENTILILLLFILAFALFAGFEAVAKTETPKSLPLLSGINIPAAGIILAALLSAGLTYGGRYDFAALLGGVATALAAAALTGSFLLAEREEG